MAEQTAYLRTRKQNREKGEGPRILSSPLKANPQGLEDFPHLRGSANSVGTKSLTYGFLVDIQDPNNSRDQDMMKCLI
jgi:hypothetical protein